jgi:cysteine-rich repeat protein
LHGRKVTDPDAIRDAVLAGRSLAHPRDLPVAGNAMNLRALQLDERRSATGSRGWSVRSSLDGFATDIAVFTVPDDTNTRTETAQLPAQFHDLTTAVEFRIFGFQSEATSGTRRIDNAALISGVASTCGDGFVDAGEQCDDGNDASHDGCSATCTIELVTRSSFQVRSTVTET